MTFFTRDCLKIRTAQNCFAQNRVLLRELISHEIFKNNQCIFSPIGKKFFENNHLIDHNKAVHNIISETPMTPTIEKKDQEKRKITKTTSVSEEESDTEEKNDNNRYFAYSYFLQEKCP